LNDLIRPAVLQADSICSIQYKKIRLTPLCLIFVKEQVPLEKRSCQPLLVVQLESTEMICKKKCRFLAPKKSVSAFALEFFRDKLFWYFELISSEFVDNSG